MCSQCNPQPTVYVRRDGKLELVQAGSPHLFETHDYDAVPAEGDEVRLEPGTFRRYVVRTTTETPQ